MARRTSKRVRPSEFDSPMARRMSERLRRAHLQDRFGSLPDDILVHYILPHLPTGEVVRTRFLAQRWRTLWTRVPSMDFAPKKAADVPTKKLVESFFHKNGGTASKFAKWVDRVMGAYDGGTATLRQFRLVFPLDVRYSCEIEQWLNLPLEKGVEVLELDFCGYFPGRENPEFPVIPPALASNLRMLKCLSLGGVSIASDTLEHLLRECESLESLKLHRCTALTRISVTGPVSRLKSVDIRGYYYKLKSISISAPTPDLVSLTYPGDPNLTLHIEHAPRLVDLFIGQNVGGPGFDLTSHPLFPYVSQLETLHIRNSSWDKAMHWLPCLRDLSRLKNLKLTLDGFYFQQGLQYEQSLRGLASVVEAASCVRHLTLDVKYIYQKVKIEQEFDNLQLQHLRVIEIVGSRGRKVDCELPLHLIKGAASLEKLIIDFRDPFHQGCKLNEYDSVKSTLQKRKKRVKGLIEPKIPSNVKLLLI